MRTPEKKQLRLGYLRLTDAAPLIVAYELGIYQKYGLAVELYQEVSWANVRDKLVAGALDAAQMLAPLPAMTTYGASGMRAHLLTGLVLSRNGNGITLSNELKEKLGGTNDLLRRMATIVRDDKHRLTFATVHAFSTHTLLLRRWLRSVGVHPDKVSTIVVPPSQMVDSLQSGVVDGFCVGEPWNSLAVASDVGSICAFGSVVWPGAADKVLGVTQDWHQCHPTTHLRLRLALIDACAWLTNEGNRRIAAEQLAKRGYLNVAVEHLLPSLTGQMWVDNDQRVACPDFHMFGGQRVNRPQLQETKDMITHCSELLGKPIDNALVETLAARSCRTDLFDQATQAQETKASET